MHSRYLDILQRQVSHNGLSFGSNRLKSVCRAALANRDNLAEVSKLIHEQCNGENEEYYETLRVRAQSLPKTLRQKDSGLYQLANMVISLYSLYEDIDAAISATMIRYNKWSRVYSSGFNDIVGIMEQVKEEVKETRIAASTSDKMLSTETVSRTERERKFCAGGGFLSGVSSYHVCPKCKHSNVDELPGNNNIVEENQASMQEFLKINKHWKEFQAGARHDAPTTNSGRKILNNPPPKPKFKKVLLHCHCHQMRKARSGDSNAQSTCPILCKDPATGKLYRGNSCPICTCQCNFVFDKARIAEIHTAVQMQQSNSMNLDLSMENQRHEANAFLNNAHNQSIIDRQAASQYIIQQKAVGQMQCDAIQESRYISDVASLSRASYYVQTAPNLPAERYLTSMVDSVQGQNPTMIMHAGVQRDLRVSATTTAAAVRANNNNFIPNLVANAPIDLLDDQDEVQIIDNPLPLKNVAKVKSPGSQWRERVMQQSSYKVRQSGDKDEKQKAKNTAAELRKYHGTGKFQPVVDHLTIFGAEPFADSQDALTKFEDEIMD